MKFWKPDKIRHYWTADNATGSYIGNMAHTRIWNRVLTTTEITQEYNRMKSIYGN